MVTKASCSDTAVSPGTQKSAGDPPEAGEEAKKGPLWWKRGSVTPFSLLTSIKGRQQFLVVLSLVCGTLFTAALGNAYPWLL